MGTSKRYEGRNKNPLLPSDFEDNQVNRKQNSWSSAKNFMSRYASGSSGIKGKKNAVSNYVKAYGGARGATRTAKSGIKSAVGFVSFFSEVSEKGIEQALKDNNISFEGKKPKEILNEIVNFLAPDPNSLENSIARKAFDNTFSSIYQKFEEENIDISVLDEIKIENTIILLKKYIESYIYYRLILDMGYRIEQNAKSLINAVRIEQDLKEYIEVVVNSTINSNSITNIKKNILYQTIEELFRLCYNVLEEQL